MRIEKSINNKILAAKLIISKNATVYGLQAGSDRYRDQFWTRDFFFCLPALLELKKTQTIKYHFDQILKNQSTSGKIPMQYQNSKKLLKYFKDILKVKNLPKTLFTGLEFLKFNIGKSIDITKPGAWTGDNEILLILIYKLLLRNKIIEKNQKLEIKIKKAYEFINNKLLMNGVIISGDWRDTILSFRSEALLTNNVNFLKVIEYFNPEKAGEFKKRINERFWNGEYYLDRIGYSDFDLLGQSLAIIYGVADISIYEKIIQKIKSMDTKYGLISNDNKPSNYVLKHKLHLSTNQYSMIWPFINGKTIEALIAMNETELAKEQFYKWTLLDGFFEWYDPTTGKGMGETELSMSAAQYLSSYLLLRNNNLLI